MSNPTPSRMRESTQWTRQLTAPLRSSLRTESGSAGVLLAAIVAALIWSNVDAGSYESLWRTSLSIRLGDLGVTRELGPGCTAG